ncbi:hypothetical protein [Brevibacillus nitrificans]|uniref:hypothetical protein n=1 Tax=Brevibacillus nitrificans TaxID=651560 RepID=UPI0016060247|nr:hypothetical protein [Brevibacillus nitrificans]
MNGFVMAVMGRSLLVGALAWILGNGAFHVFPSRYDHLASMGEWLSMLLFSPVELFLSLVLFVVATALLLGLLHFHIFHFFQVRFVDRKNAWMHVFMSFFSLFLFTVQFVKMPIPTVLLAGWVVIYEATQKRLLFLGKRKN